MRCKKKKKENATLTNDFSFIVRLVRCLGVDLDVFFFLLVGDAD